MTSSDTKVGLAALVAAFSASSIEGDWLPLAVAAGCLLLALLLEPK